MLHSYRGRRTGTATLAALALCWMSLGAGLSPRAAAAQAAPAATTPPAAAATSAPPAAGAAPQGDRVEQLEQELRQLRADVAALKQAQAAAAAEAARNQAQGQAGAAAAPAAPAAADRVAEVERRLDVLAGELEKMKVGEAAVAADTSVYGLGPAASKVYRGGTGLSIGGYGEILYQHAADSRPGASDFERESEGSQFDIRRAVLYAGYKWNDHWVLNSEIEFEHAGSEIGVEFAYLDYLWRPEANFRAGLMLMPVGLINEYHEPTVFLGADRPGVEQAIIPSTWAANGFGVFGQVGNLTYRTYLVAGLDATGFAADGIGEGRQESRTEISKNLGWVGRLDYTPVPGLMIGGSAYTGGSGQGLRSPEGSILSVPTRVYEGHLEWKWRGLQFRTLGAVATLGDVAALNETLGLTGNQSIGERMSGSYYELGYDVLAGHSGQRSLTPYVRYEDYNTQDRVPSGFSIDPANHVRSLTAGVAFKPFEQVILKVDQEHFYRGERADQFHALLGYIF